MSLIAVIGSTAAFTAIKWIGHRAHPLLSVNYFASICTVISTLALLLPGTSVSFTLPATLRQWLLLISLGVFGYIMQFLLTYGLSYEKGGRAQNMIYAQMLFAVLFDWVVFGQTMGVWTGVGSACIMGGAVWVAMQKGQRNGEGEKEGRVAEDDEAVGLMEMGGEGEGVDERRGEHTVRVT